MSRRARWHSVELSGARFLEWFGNRPPDILPDGLPFPMDPDANVRVLWSGRVGADTPPDGMPRCVVTNRATGRTCRRRVSDAAGEVCSFHMDEAPRLYAVVCTACKADIGAPCRENVGNGKTRPLDETFHCARWSTAGLVR